MLGEAIGSELVLEHLWKVLALVARDFVCGNYSSKLRMLVFEDERVTPVYIISLLGSVSHYKRSGPRGRQFKKNSGSSSSGSGSSSSGSSKVEFCGQCGGRHPAAQCVGVQDSCNICGQYGHFARVCPLAGSQHTAGSCGWIV
ncbi:hypothetical protein F511_12617 [Dorcoceras hygrometricum]|uniref:CCHC-type domain-containing protein n=1 Tax=Dorcoceras hygrometricum TaxID=472368 RepID=A0A2Z7BJJ7_9LAMI|nr:hypothetical protein F511_12617 [Dorcoceras hygrometricum]